MGGLSTTPAEYRRSRGAQPRALRNVPAVVAYRGGATLVAGKPSFLVFPYQRQAGPLGQKASLLDIAPPGHGYLSASEPSDALVVPAPGLGGRGAPLRRGLKVMSCVLTGGDVRSDARSPLSPGHSP